MQSKGEELAAHGYGGLGALNVLCQQAGSSSRACDFTLKLPTSLNASLCAALLWAGASSRLHFSAKELLCSTASQRPGAQPQGSTHWGAHLLAHRCSNKGTTSCDNNLARFLPAGNRLEQQCWIMAGRRCKQSLSKAATDAMLIPFCFSTSLPNCVSLAVALAWKRMVASCACPVECIFVKPVWRQRTNLPVFAKLAAPLQELILGRAWASSATTVARDALAAFDASTMCFPRGCGFDLPRAMATRFAEPCCQQQRLSSRRFQNTCREHLHFWLQARSLPQQPGAEEREQPAI